MSLATKVVMARRQLGRGGCSSAALLFASGVLLRLLFGVGFLERGFGFAFDFEGPARRQPC